MKVTLTQVDDVIAIIILNHGKVNALSKALLDEISSAFDSLSSSPVRVVVLRAQKGASVFSAGHDVRELPTNGRDPLTYNDPLRQVVRKIENCPLPVIAMIEGSVWGGACELVLGCDIIVAAEDSTFALTPARLGVPYDIHGTLNLIKVAGMHAGSRAIAEFIETVQPEYFFCGHIHEAEGVEIRIGNTFARNVGKTGYLLELD